MEKEEKRIRFFVDCPQEVKDLLDNSGYQRRVGANSRNSFALLLIQIGLEDMDSLNRLLLDRAKAMKTEETRLDTMLNEKYRLGLKIMGKKGLLDQT
jgi:hypothetical protein